MVSFRALFLTMVISAALGACPYDDVTLHDWSDPDTWPNGEVPDVDSVVKIWKKIRLNVSPPKLKGIEINGGGSLVWGKIPGEEINLNTHYIHIKDGGKMVIGSEDCNYDAKTTITLLGTRGVSSIPDFGEKFIGVDAGGTFECHGKKTLAWTKLTGTISGFNALTLDFRHKEQPGIKNWNGAYLYHFSADGTFVKSLFRGANSIDTTEYMNFVTGVPTSDIIAMATQGDLDNNVMSKLYPVVDVLDTTNQVRKHWINDAYVFAARKGDTFKDDIGIYQFGHEYSEATMKLDILGNSNSLVVMSRNNKEVNVDSYVDFLIMDQALANPIIDVVDDVGFWPVGDKIYVTSTDYDWKQVEEFTIMECPQCLTNQIQLNKPPRFSHYGEIFKRVDMRAEVFRTTRNIHITSEVAEGESNGGHIKFLYGFKTVKVENVELTNLGDPLVTGRYPLHYHMCENLADKMIYVSESYLQNNSIHHSQFRCITIHGTHNAKIKNNICLNSVGHGLFVEDGGEKHTLFEGNLALGQRAWTGLINHPITGALPSDREPVTYWITNPLTKMINNVAAGSDFIGIWFLFPEAPIGPSATKNFMRPGEAKHTPVELFTNNVIHSYGKTGLFVDNQLFPNQTVNKVYNKLNTRMTPTDTTSERVPMIFDRTTAFKCRNRNLWIRGGPTIVRYASLAESMEVAALVKEQTSYQLFEKSVVIGLTENLGEPQNVKAKDGSILKWSRSMPKFNLANTIRGFQFRRGPVFVRSCFFGGFQPTDQYNAAAFTHSACVLEFNSRNYFMSTFFDFADGSNAGNRFLHVPCKKQVHSDATLAIKDFKNDFYIVKNIPFTTTEECSYRSNWGAAKCPHDYGQISVYTPPTGNNMFVARTDVNFPIVEVYDQIPSQRFITILGGRFNYLFYFKTAVPKNIFLVGSSITKSKTVVLAYCIPRNAAFNMKFKIGDTELTTTQVNSLEKVQSDTDGGKFFFDQTVGVVFFKMLHNKDFMGELSQCPQNRCPTVNIFIGQGDMSDNDCSGRFQTNPSYLQPAPNGQPTESVEEMPADFSSPPGWIGAGASYPFPQ